MTLDARDNGLATWLKSGGSSGVLLDDIAVVSRFAHAGVLEEVAFGFLLCDGRYGRGAVPSVTHKVAVEGGVGDRKNRDADSFFVIGLRQQHARRAFVTVGRLDGNDVALLDPRVSKLHALFMSSGSGGLYVFDANSTNGTFVNHERAAARGAAQGTRVESGDCVCFGGVNTTFLVAADLFTFVREHVA